MKSNSNKEVLIAGRRIGRGVRPFIIAEIAQAHDGSLGTAHAYIDAVADIGVDAVKFQTHIADEESTFDEAFRVHFSTQDNSRFDYWKRMEFTEPQWRELAQHAEARGLVFLSSAFSVAAVELLDRLGISAWKVGSGEFWSNDLLEAMVATNKPLLISTGLCGYDDIDNLTSGLTARSVPYALFQCTSMYPSPLETVGLNLIDDLSSRYECPVGLSDHSGSVFPSLAAIARGCPLVEVHVTFHKKCFGPDVASSLDLDQLKLLVQGRDEIFSMLSSEGNKEIQQKKLESTKKLFRKSLALREDQVSGVQISREHLTTKKPGSGIPPEKMQQVLGKVLKRDVKKNRLLNWQDFV